MLSKDERAKDIVDIVHRCSANNGERVGCQGGGKREEKSGGRDGRGDVNKFPVK